MQMFIVAFFIIALNWRQLNHPLISEWVNKLWCIHTTLHSKIKEQTIDTHKNMDESQIYYTKWRKPELITNTVWFHLYYILEQAQLWKQKTDQCLQGSGRLEEAKWLQRGTKEPLGWCKCSISWLLHWLHNCASV